MKIYNKKSFVLGISNLVVILSLLFGGSQIYAAANENAAEFHRDTESLCMTARQVEYKKDEVEEYIKTGTMESRILEDAIIDVLNIDNTVRYTQWHRYEGSLDLTLPVELSSLQELDKMKKSQEVTVTVNALDTPEKAALNFSVFIRIEDTGTESETVTPQKTEVNQEFSEGAEEQREAPLHKKKKDSGSFEANIALWSVNAVLSTGFVGSIYSDFRVIRWYKRKKKEAGR